MTTKQAIRYFEDNGGLNIHILRQEYSFDMRRAKKVVSFKKWLAELIRYDADVSRYVANRVAEYYTL